jgi:fructokinase
MNRKVYTIGETVLDIIFQKNIPMAAKAGGAMLNVAVSLGRLKLPVHFISEYGTDQVGKMIDGFLTSNGINTNNIYRFSNGKSALALAFLDENQNASYSFYKSYPSKRLDIEFPDFGPLDIVLFGSFYGITPEIRETLMILLKKAKEAGSLIIYDPNFRKSHLHELPNLLPSIYENIKIADIIKGSNEDFEILFNAKTPDDAFKALNDSNKILFYTAGNKGAFFYSENRRLFIQAKPIIPLSTIGAGDNFNAGIVFGLFQNNIHHLNFLNMEQEIWENILFHGNNFAAEVCLSYDNYISDKFASNYLS